MLAASLMSNGAQAFFFGAALIVFLVATVLAAMVKNYYGALVAVGLALWVFVAFWNAVALA